MDGYDDVAESTEEANNKKIEELEALWSDSKIAEMVAQSLQTGVFEGIDGAVVNLQDAMLEFAEASGETFGVLGTAVKEELIANLGIALDTLKNYSEIMEGLGLDKVDPSMSTGSINSKSVNTGDIKINVTSQPGMNEEDLARKIQDAVSEALKGAVEGL